MIQAVREMAECFDLVLLVSHWAEPMLGGELCESKRERESMWIADDQSMGRNLPTDTKYPLNTQAPQQFPDILNIFQQQQQPLRPLPIPAALLAKALGPNHGI